MASKSSQRKRIQYQLFVSYPGGQVYPGIYSQRREDIESLSEIMNARYNRAGKSYFVNAVVI